MLVEDEQAFERIWDEVCIIGTSLAREGGFELPDEWPNLVTDWLLEHRPGVLWGTLEREDVRAAFTAWEIGTQVAP